MSSTTKMLDALYYSLKENVELVQDAFTNRDNKEPSGPYAYCVEDLNCAIPREQYTALFTWFLYKNTKEIKYVEVDFDCLLKHYVVVIQTDVNNWNNHTKEFSPLRSVKLERKAK